MTQLGALLKKIGSFQVGSELLKLKVAHMSLVRAKVKNIGSYKVARKSNLKPDVAHISHAAAQVKKIGTSKVSKLRALMFACTHVPGSIGKVRTSTSGRLHAATVALFGPARGEPRGWTGRCHKISTASSIIISN